MGILKNIAFLIAYHFSTFWFMELIDLCTERLIHIKNYKILTLECTLTNLVRKEILVIKIFRTIFDSLTKTFSCDVKRYLIKLIYILITTFIYRIYLYLYVLQLKIVLYNLYVQ